VKRVSRLLFHNWPLKLAAIVLATMLYAGFVLSQSVLEYTGGVQIVPLNIPATASLGDNLPQVTRIRYYAVGNASARAAPDSFKATIDLADVDATGGSTFVPVNVQSNDPRFTVVDFEPRSIRLSLDPLKVRTGILVNVIQGLAPENLEVRQAVVTPGTVSIEGPASVVDRVTEVQATVNIEPSGLDIDRDVDLIPVDALGDRVTPVDVEPATAHVRIEVFNVLRSRPLPVTPTLSGAPAAGYEVTAITVDPLLVSVEGEADLLVDLAQADTAPVSVTGATKNVVQDVGLALPEGVLPVGGDFTVRVTVTIKAIATTRTYDAGVILAGVNPGLDYHLSVTHALATLGGALTDLDRLDGASFVLTAQVGSLGPGTHDVTLSATPPLGLSIVRIEPGSVTVTITPIASPSPSASPS
jgi:YbbR domain-containing protein